ncbi:MAG TPA: hypothetical protein ENN19_16900 [Chloroflexi bacterium]|nr:hypothetical protein [Chloroflexota bacterium]
MARVKIEIRPLTIQMDGPLVLGTGFRRGLIHRTVERDADGFACIPASSLKGRVRRACEQLAKDVGLRVCHAPRPSGMCSAHKQACLVCRVFGAPGRGSNLRWQDARLPEVYRSAFKAIREAQFYARTQVQLSRALGTSAPERLFTSEFTVEDLHFASSITGWLEITPIAGDELTGGYEILLLIAGLRLINTIGGAASRGAGWISLTLPEKVRIGDMEVHWKKILENVELLRWYQEEKSYDN